MKDIRHICLLGLGEVGRTLATDLASLPDIRITAWDWQFDDPFSIPSRNAFDRPYVQRAAEAALAAKGCNLVISAVTAAQALHAANSIAPGLKPDAWFLDLNSISPQSKREVGAAVEATGARFVEVAVMSAIAPLRSAAPMLAGGPHAQSFMPLAQALGFTGMRPCPGDTGRAAATKMCRSVVVKGVEALLTEALLAARYHGVEEEVIASLGDLFPHPDWNRQARYMIARSLEHGVRRAEELREAARTVAEAGIAPTMSEACAVRQDWAAQFAESLAEAELAEMLDSILALNDSRTGHPRAEEGSG